MSQTGTSILVCKIMGHFCQQCTGKESLCWFFPLRKLSTESWVCGGSRLGRSGASQGNFGTIHVLGSKHRFSHQNIWSFSSTEGKSNKSKMSSHSPKANRKPIKARTAWVKIWNALSIDKMDRLWSRWIGSFWKIPMQTSIAFQLIENACCDLQPKWE